MKALRPLLPYLLRYKGRIALGFVSITVSNVLAVYVPKVIGDTIDSLNPEVTGGTEALTHGDLLANVGWILLLTAFSGLFLFVTRQTIIVMSRLVENDLRNDFLSHVQSLPMRYFGTTPTGDIMALATNDIPAVRNFVGPAIMYSANTLTTFIFAVSMMMTLSVKITLLALLPLPLVSYTVYKLGKRVHSLFGQVQGQYANLTSNAQEAMSGVRVIRGYVRETFAESTFGKLSDLYRLKNMDLVKVEALMMPAMMLLIGLSQVIVLGMGGYELVMGRTTIGEITQFFAYISLLIWPMIAIGWVTNIVQRGAASMKRLNDVMNIAPEVNRGVEGADEPLRGKVEFRNVSFRYDPEMPPVLKNISFVVEPGETLAIVGMTGVGKTTIVNLIARLYDPTAGEIFIDDRPIGEIPLQQLRDSIGTVAQETFLFSRSIGDNIRYGDPAAGDEEVLKASGIAQLHDNVDDFSERYETLVGERGVTLSGGQKQRTAIARAILRNPSILILDDALSAVDTETEERILSGMREVMGKRTTILIAHRISTVKGATRIILIHDGEIAERGTHEELVARGGRYASVHEKQLLEDELENM